MLETKMHTLYNEYGNPVQVNDNSLEHALSVCGWSKVDPVKKAKADKKKAKAAKESEQSNSQE